MRLHREVKIPKRRDKAQVVNSITRITCFSFPVRSWLPWSGHSYARAKTRGDEVEMYRAEQLSDMHYVIKFGSTPSHHYIFHSFKLVIPFAALYYIPRKILERNHSSQSQA